MADLTAGDPLLPLLTVSVSAPLFEPIPPLGRPSTQCPTTPLCQSSTDLHSVSHSHPHLPFHCQLHWPPVSVSSPLSANPSTGLHSVWPPPLSANPLTGLHSSVRPHSLCQSLPTGTLHSVSSTPLWPIPPLASTQCPPPLSAIPSTHSLHSGILPPLSANPSHGPHAQCPSHPSLPNPSTGGLQSSGSTPLHANPSPHWTSTQCPPPPLCQSLLLVSTQCPPPLAANPSQWSPTQCPPTPLCLSLHWPP
ncbi:unnamed protein product, partial [Staurois parvus]